jgi:hypothetical protein
VTGEGPGAGWVVPRYDELRLRDAHEVCAVLHAASEANLTAPCRRGSIDVVDAAPGERLIATGDLHDNALHMGRLVRAAALEDAPEGASPAHLTLHEVIHGGSAETLVNEMDFSYRALVRVAALKARHPGHVHTLLANHELSQIVGAGVMKDGVNFVRAFNDAVEFTFGDEAARVKEAIAGFIRSMPLALRFVTARGVLQCSHSLPGPEMMDRFDPAVMERGLEEEDYTPRRGAAHIMVWGREHTADQLQGLAERWGVGLFVLGHEHAEDGVLIVGPNAVVLNSDHERGVYLAIDAADAPMDATAAMGCVRRL